MRRPWALMAILGLAAAPEGIVAQQVAPAGVVEVRRAESANGIPVVRPMPHSLVADSAAGHPWRWIGSGAVVGAAAGGVAAAASASRTDDAFFGGQAIGLAAVGGGVVGGLLGGLLYLITH